MDGHVDAISMRFGYLRDACEILARNVQSLLILAGEPVTRHNVKKVVKSLPGCGEDLVNESWRREYFNTLMIRTESRVKETSDAVRFSELIEYFIEYIPCRSFIALDLLSAAFLGVLTIEYEQSGGK